MWDIYPWKFLELSWKKYQKSKVMASWELLKKVVSKSEKKIVKIYQKGNLTIQLVIIKPIKDNIFFYYWKLGRVYPYSPFVSSIWEWLNLIRYGTGVRRYLLQLFKSNVLKVHVRIRLEDRLNWVLENFIYRYFID